MTDNFYLELEECHSATSKTEMNCFQNFMHDYFYKWILRYVNSLDVCGLEVWHVLDTNIISPCGDLCILLNTRIWNSIQWWLCGISWHAILLTRCYYAKCRGSTLPKHYWRFSQTLSINVFWRSFTLVCKIGYKTKELVPLGSTYRDCFMELGFIISDKVWFY